MSCDNVITVQDLETDKKHSTFYREVITGKAGGTGADIDSATNAATGQTQATLPKVLSNVGFSPSGFDFTTGGTLTERDKAIFYQTDGNWYSWGGTLPKVVPPASSPASTGGISDNAWNVSTSAFMYRDWEGFTAELLAQAGIVDDDQPDELGASQRVDAMRLMFSNVGTVADIAAGKFKAGSMISVTDRSGALFIVVAGGAPNGFDVIDAGDGNSAVLYIDGGKINTSHWGVIEGEDAQIASANTLAFNRILQVVNNERPNDSFVIELQHDTVIADTLKINGGGTYGGRTVRLTSSRGRVALTKTGASSTAPLNSIIYIAQPTTSGAFACCNVKISSVYLRSFTSDYGIASADQVTFFESKEVNIYLTKSGAIGYYFTNFLYINRFDTGLLDCAGMAFKNTLSGTTNRFDNLFASNCQDGGYEFRMIYSSAGALAADNCKGSAYTFHASQMDVSSLGCESPEATYIVISRQKSRVNIGQINLYLFTASATYTLVSAFDESDVNVGVIASPDAVLAMPSARMFNVPALSSVKVDTIAGGYTYGAPDIVAANASLLIPDKSGELVSIRESGISSTGGGRSSNPQHYTTGVNRPAKTIFLNHGALPTSLVDGTNVQFSGQGLKSGDVILFNDPVRSGSLGVQVATAGADFNSSQYAYIPVEQVVADTASIPTSLLRSGRKVCVISLKKTLTYYSSPAGWYDESGSKVV